MVKRKTVKRKSAPKRKSPAKSRTVASTAPALAPEKIDDFVSLQKIFDDAARSEDAGCGLRTTDVECPHCGEEFEISVDPSEEGQEMIQDCQVCCRSITFAVEIEDGELSVSAYQD